MSFLPVRTLLYKEVLRFWKVHRQTVLAPIVTALLYLLVFQRVMDAGPHGPETGYLNFVLPGVAIMCGLQNAFSNALSSLIQSKISGNIVFMLLSPLSYWEVLAAYTLASCLRGFCITAGVLLVVWPFIGLEVNAPGWALLHLVIGLAFFSVLGVISGVIADSYDEQMLYQNFIITPMTFLAGTFYSVATLTTFWRVLSHVNPALYIVEGFRHGFLGHSNVPPLWSAAVCCVMLLGAFIVAAKMLESGHKLRS